MTTTARTLVAVLLLAGAGLAVALTSPQLGLTALLVEDGGEPTLPAPPELRLHTPADGEGGGPWIVAGEALSASGRILDVQVRVDGGRWRSIPDAPRGERAAPFRIQLDEGPGDHLIETRAYDGEAFSLAERALVRSGAPTVRILAPLDGASLPAGETVVSGTLEGSASGVVVERAGQATPALVVGKTWSAPLTLGPGEHVLTVRALGSPGSLPRAVTVAVGSPVPPALSIVRPADGAAFGSAGDDTCGGCILFAGSAPGAADVLVTLDGLPAGRANLTPAGVWTWNLSMSAVGTGEHRAAFRPVDERGQAGAERDVRFHARTPRALAIVGDAAPAPTGTTLIFHGEGAVSDATRWSLDGEPIGTGPGVEISLARGGDHVLTAITPDVDGRAATAVLPLHAFNRPPEVALARRVDAATAAIVLEADAHDADGAVHAYLWSFGDGHVERTSRPEATHRYPVKGTYQANVTAIDDLGGASLATIQVEVANVAPFANITWTPAEPTTLDLVVLRDASVDPEGAGIAQRRWSVDNVTTNAQNFTHRFATRGDHVATLRVVDAEGAESFLAQTIRVRNLAPAARLYHEPALPQSGREVVFTDASIDPDGPIRSWSWSFGDGATATTQHALHAYERPGEYLVNLTVIDDVGAVNLTSLVVRVSDAPPQVSAVEIEPAEPVAKQAVAFRAIAGNRAGGGIVPTWDFGDGVQSGEPEPTHRYARSGLYHGRVVVVNEAGLATAYPFAVRVANALPNASLVAPEETYALFPTRLAAEGLDDDGSVVIYRFDADGDGAWDCEGDQPECLHAFESPGEFLARVEVEDDEGGKDDATLLLDILPPPSNLAPPVVRVELPKAGGLLADDGVISGTATGVRPIVRVDLQLRNGSWAYSGSRDPWRLAEGTSAWRASFPTRSLPDGVFELVVRATDSDGGIGFTRVPVRVENGPRASEVSVRLLDLPAEITGDALVHGVAFHPEGVTLVRWRLDEGPWQTVSDRPFAFTLPLDHETLAPGAHTLRVDAYRGIAENATVVQGFLVPGDPPILVVDDPPAPIAYGILAAAGRIEGEGRAQWRLDHGLWRDVTPGQEWAFATATTDIPDGDHTLGLRAISHDARVIGEVLRYDVRVVNPPFSSSGSDALTPAPVRAETPAGAWLALAALAVAFALRRR